MTLLMMSTDRGACEATDEGSGVLCIPDLQSAKNALTGRRGTPFTVYLHKTGDKYIRSRDYDCLYQLLKPVDETTLSIREARSVLLYRILAQLGRSHFVEAHITYGWLSELLALEADHEFDTLLKNKLREISDERVEEFEKNIDRFHAGAMKNSEETVLFYLVTFAANRLDRWDYLTLKRCSESVKPHSFSPAERLYLYSIQVIVNLQLGLVAEAYDAYKKYLEMAGYYPEGIITEETIKSKIPLYSKDAFTRFYTITDEKLHLAFEEFCENGVDHCGVLTPSLSALAHLETEALADRECAGAWMCVKMSLDKIVTPDAFYKPIPENKVRFLFFLAKSNMMLKDYQTAHRQLLGLKTSDRIKNSIYADPVEQMVNTCVARIRESRQQSFKDKFADITEIFYHTARNRFLAVSALSLFLIFFFIQWHLSFKKQSSGFMSMISTLGKIPRLNKPSEKVLDGLHKSRKLIFLPCRVFDDKDINIEPRHKIGLPGDHSGSASELATYSRDIVRLLSLQTPYPICFIARLPGYKPKRHFWYYMACGAVVALLATWVLAYGKPMPWGDQAMLFFVLTATLVAALTGIRIMARQVLRCLQEIATMLESIADFKKVEQETLVMFRDPWQFFVAFVIYGLFFTISKDQLPSTHAVIVLIILMMCPIHWMMISSLLFTRVLCDIHDLSINPLSPLKTWGLQKWIAVIGTFATTGSVIITFASAIPIMTNWKNLTGKDIFWICAMLPLLLAYWIYPYFRIRNLVRRFKLIRMHFVKTHISQAYDSWQALAAAAAGTGGIDDAQLKRIENQMDRLNRYYGLFKVIDQSPEFFVDVYSILELAKVMGIPSLFAVGTYLLRLL
ncbi:hypothetical protein [uncultured Desulfosarcina sp.]|uniref:hypothetical protein n=1 Tax=uncultured Desulfosarcina sp. TaxID=218289 RepID=UPI0029C6D2F6|nr:hypothetical protein [uncultured Desulfosarcina sp.]